MLAKAFIWGKGPLYLAFCGQLWLSASSVKEDWSNLRGTALLLIKCTNHPLLQTTIKPLTLLVWW